MSREIKTKACDEFPMYEVSTDGKIFSLYYKNTKNRKELKQYVDSYGYLYVYFVVDGIRFKKLSHRLVAIAFIPNPENKPQVNHIDGVKTNNHVENLEWNTCQENVDHYHKYHKKPATKKLRKASSEGFSGIKNPKAKINQKQANEIIALRKSGLMLKEIAPKYGISVQQVSAIANGKFWNKGNIHEEQSKPTP